MSCYVANDVPTKAKIEEIVETMIEDGHDAREIGDEVPLREERGQVNAASGGGGRLPEEKARTSFLR